MTIFGESGEYETYGEYVLAERSPVRITITPTTIKPAPIELPPEEPNPQGKDIDPGIIVPDEMLEPENQPKERDAKSIILKEDGSLGWATDPEQSIVNAPATLPERLPITNTPAEQFTEAAGKLTGYPADVARRGLEATEKLTGALKQVMSGEIPATEGPGLEAIVEAASWLGTGGLATAPMRAGAGTFGGVLGINSSKQALDLTLAKHMEQRGMDVKQIFDATGFMKQPDGLWRFEVNDSLAALSPHLPIIKPFPNNQNIERVSIKKFLEDAAQDNQRVVLGDIFDHPELYQRYPDLRNIEIRFMERDPNKPNPAIASYNVNANIMKLSDMSPKDLRDTILHELQHGIQGLEGFARGGAPGEFLSPVYTKVKGIAESAKEGLKERIEKAGYDFNELSIAIMNEKWVKNELDRLNREPSNIPKGWGDVDREELQKAIDSLDKAKRSGFAKELRTLEKIEDEVKDLTDRAFAEYQLMLGEIEARNVQLRDKLRSELESRLERMVREPAFDTPRTRQAIQEFREMLKYPWETQDIKDMSKATVKGQFE